MEERKLDLLMVALLLSRAGGEVVFMEDEIEALSSVSNLRIESHTLEDGNIRMRLVQGSEECGYTYH